MESVRPKGMIGMRHVALFVSDMEKSQHFYSEILGMCYEFVTPEGSVFLTNGGDCLALHHREGKGVTKGAVVHHIGFMLESKEAADLYHAYLVGHGVKIAEGLKLHRDGSYGFYAEDPDGVLVEIIYHPPITK